MEVLQKLEYNDNHPDHPICVICDTPIVVQPGKKVPDTCSRSCGSKLSHGHPNADAQGYVKEHTLVMSEHLGRPLTPEEIVHHKDGNKQNNSLDNLQVMTKSEHTRLHNTLGHTGQGL